MISESTLGAGPESATTPPADPQTYYRYVAIGTPVSDASCAAASSFNYENRRGFTWATGELRTGSYNHYLLPNAPTPDCITNNLAQGYTTSGFRAARSKHTGGVMLALGDGSVRFVSNSIGILAWRAVGTRGGGEVIGDPN